MIRTRTAALEEGHLPLSWGVSSTRVPLSLSSSLSVSRSCDFHLLICRLSPFDLQLPLFSPSLCPHQLSPHHILSDPQSSAIWSNSRVHAFRAGEGSARNGAPLRRGRMEGKLFVVDHGVNFLLIVIHEAPFNVTRWSHLEPDKRKSIVDYSLGFTAAFSRFAPTSSAPNSDKIPRTFDVRDQAALFPIIVVRDSWKLRSTSRSTRHSPTCNVASGKRQILPQRPAVQPSVGTAASFKLSTPANNGNLQLSRSLGFVQASMQRDAHTLRHCPARRHRQLLSPPGDAHHPGAYPVFCTSCKVLGARTRKRPTIGGTVISREAEAHPHIIIGTSVLLNAPLATRTAASEPSATPSLMSAS